MTTRREKSKPQKPQLNNQLETAQTEQKPVGTEDHSIAFEAGKFCLDIAKLVFGGVILAGIMQQGIEFNSLFLTGLGVVLLFVAFGFYLIKKSNKKIGGNNYDADIIFMVVGLIGLVAFIGTIIYFHRQDVMLKGN